MTAHDSAEPTPASGGLYARRAAHRRDQPGGSLQHHQAGGSLQDRARSLMLALILDPYIADCKRIAPIAPARMIAESKCRNLGLRLSYSIGDDLLRERCSEEPRHSPGKSSDEIRHRPSERSL